MRGKGKSKKGDGTKRRKKHGPWDARAVGAADIVATDFNPLNGEEDERLIIFDER